MADTRKETKEDMQRQAKRAKAANILKNMHYQDISSALDNLVGKYGIDAAYKLIQSAALEPFEVGKKVNSPIRTSRAALDYMLKNKLPDRTVAAIVKQDVSYVQASCRYKVTNVHSNASAKTSRQRVENRVNARNAQNKKQKSSPSKPMQAQADNANLPPYIRKPEENSLLRTGDEWQSYMQSHSWKPSPVEKKKTALELSPGKNVKETVGKKDKSLSIEELMGMGVTAEDIQSVIDKDPNMVHQLKPGTTNSKLARAARKKGDKTKGKCLSGVQEMVNPVLGTEQFWKNGEWWKDIPKLPGAEDNSACNAHKALANSGKFIPVAVRNKAFNNQGKNQEMNDFVDKCAVGTIINCDGVANLSGYAGTSGSKDGHVFVIEDANGKKQCDFEQHEINYCNYGQYIHISLATDMNAPESFAEKCLAAKRAREQKEKGVQKIALKKSRTQGR